MKVTHRSLQVLLAFILSIVCSFGTSGETSTNTTHQVKGIVGRWVSFPVKVSPGKQVEKIEWVVINPRSETPYRLCEFRDGKLKKTDFFTWAKALWDKSAEVSMMTRRNFTIWAQQYRRLDEEREFVKNIMLRYMFGDRLEMSAGTTLTIRKMKKEDAGIYRARVWFDAERFEDHTFNVTLYEPVPSPDIQYRNLFKTPEGCNVTLQCQVYGHGKYNISWINVGGLYKDWPSDSGRNLYVSWRKGSSSSTFTCLVRNQVDQKEASFDLLTIYQDKENQRDKGSTGENIPWVLILIIVPTFSCVLLIACILNTKGKSKRRNRDIPSGTQEEGECRPPPENPMMDLPVVSSALESPTMNLPCYDDLQFDWNGAEGASRSEPPAYDSLFDCVTSDLDNCDSS